MRDLSGRSAPMWRVPVIQNLVIVFSKWTATAVEISPVLGLIVRMLIIPTIPGPDAQGRCRAVIKHSSADGNQIIDRGKVPGVSASWLLCLWTMLRGDAPIAQPHENAGNIFCWNGEVSHQHVLLGNVLLVWSMFLAYCVQVFEGMEVSHLHKYELVKQKTRIPAGSYDL